MMRIDISKSVSVLALATIIILIPAMQNGKLSAGYAGCCLQRDSTDANSPWYQISDDFDECDQLNRQLDGPNDDIFDAAGLIQWLDEC